MSEIQEGLEKSGNKVIPAEEESKLESIATTEDQQPPPKRRKVDQDIPEGMTKSQWKKLKRRKRWEETKEQYREEKKLKKKQNRLNRRLKIQEAIKKGEDVTELFPSKKHKKSEEQIHTGARVIIDCSFDDLMLEKEVVSLSSQITRAYSDNKKNPYNVELLVTSFDKRLKKRFDETLSDYKHYKAEGIQFIEESLESQLPEDLSTVYYLSADTDEKLDELKEGETYIIGGIVDKGRYKNLCKDKAEKLGIKTKRLPIGEFIELSGRRVLATSHVVELLIKWFEFKDWKKAFEFVIPPRKLKHEDEVDAKQEKKAEAIEKQ